MLISLLIRQKEGLESQDHIFELPIKSLTILFLRRLELYGDVCGVGVKGFVVIGPHRLETKRSPSVPDVNFD